MAALISAAPVKPDAHLRPAYYQISADLKEPLGVRVELWLNWRIADYLRKDEVQIGHYRAHNPGELNDTLAAFRARIAAAEIPSPIVIVISTHGSKKLRGQFGDAEAGKRFRWTPTELWKGLHRQVKDVFHGDKIMDVTTFSGLHVWLQKLREANVKSVVHVIFAQCYGGLFAKDFQAEVEKDVDQFGAHELKSKTLIIKGLSDGKTRRYRPKKSTTVSNGSWHKELTEYIRSTFPLSPEEKLYYDHRHAAETAAFKDADGKDAAKAAPNKAAGAGGAAPAASAAATAVKKDEAEDDDEQDEAEVEEVETDIDEAFAFPQLPEYAAHA